MKRKKRACEMFWRWLELSHGVKRPKVFYHWRNKAVELDDEFGFGVIVVPYNETVEIHIAADWPKYAVLEMIAHEFVHYLQHIKGEKLCLENKDLQEREAHYVARQLLIEYREYVKRLRAWRSGGKAVYGDRQGSD